MVFQYPMVNDKEKLLEVAYLANSIQSKRLTRDIECLGQISTEHRQAIARTNLEVKEI
jgi:hypothetical protein